MSRPRSSLVVLLVMVAAALTALAPVAAAKRPVRHPSVPRGFVGMNLDGPLVVAGANQAPVFDRMVSSGVESVRVPFNWAQAQPMKNGPIDFTQTDETVGLAAQRGLTVLPVVLYAPSWDATSHPVGGLARPASPAPYAAYLRALVQRYAPGGSYWNQHPATPRLPVRMWQVWNEPNFVYDWPTQPFARSYVALLQAAHAAIKRADPGAKVVIAAFPDQAWTYLRQVYGVKGARNAFDIAAAHPYTQRPQNVIRFLQLVRGVMNSHGDARKPLLVTETGWNSSRGRKPADAYCCQTTRQGQAQDVKALLPLLAANRRALDLLGFYFYTWAGQEYTGAPSFNFAGLFSFSRGRLSAKPVYRAFTSGALALENCRSMSRTAGRCKRPG